MEIRGVGGINPLNNNQPSKATQKSAPIKSLSTSDSLSVSDDARFLEDELFIKEVLAKIPDVDYDKLERIKQRLENGEYDNKDTIDKLTDNLLKSLGF